MRRRGIRRLEGKTSLGTFPRARPAGRSVCHSAPPPQVPAPPPRDFSGTMMAASWHASEAGDPPRKAPPALGEGRHRKNVKIRCLPGVWGMLTLGATTTAPRRSPPSCTGSALDQVSLAGYLLWASQPPSPPMHTRSAIPVVPENPRPGVSFYLHVNTGGNPPRSTAMPL